MSTGIRPGESPQQYISRLSATTPTTTGLHVINTTDQARIGYDASNYYTTAVDSTGRVVFDAVGIKAAFVFSDTVSATNLSGTNTGDQTSIIGNAETATALQNPRLLNGVIFNGTSDIVIPSAGGGIIGTMNFNVKEGRSNFNNGVLDSTVSNIGTGICRLLFTASQPDGNYGVFVQLCRNDDGNDNSSAVVPNDSKNTDGFNVECSYKGSLNDNFSNVMVIVTRLTL